MSSLLLTLMAFFAFLALRRVLGWVFRRWGGLMGAGSGGASQAPRQTRPVPPTETLSDQRIDEADYEELP